MKSTNIELEEHVKSMLEKRGVTLRDMAEIVYDLQVPYNNSLSVDYCEEIIDSILGKTEVQNALMLGVEIDK